VLNVIAGQKEFKSYCIIATVKSSL